MVAHRATVEEPGRKSERFKKLILAYDHLVHTGYTPGEAIQQLLSQNDNKLPKPVINCHKCIVNYCDANKIKHKLKRTAS